MNIYRTLNKNIIEKANLDEYFSFIYTREDVKEIKPNPEIYLRILKEQNMRVTLHISLCLRFSVYRRYCS